VSARSLAALQHAFQECVLHGTAEVREQIRDSIRVPAVTRLGIYAKAYRARLSEGLESNFPVLARLLGAGEFERLAHRYIEQHESGHRSIRWYGHQLADFLRMDVNYRAAPLLAELAMFEWAMTEAFDAADADVMTPANLSARPPDEWVDLRLNAHPSLRRVDLLWNAPQIWTAIQEGVDAPTAQCESVPRCWVLWRQGLQIFFRSLDPTEAGAIDTLFDQRTFGELCLELCEQLGEAQTPGRAASLIRGWVEAGMIRAVVSG